MYVIELVYSSVWKIQHTGSQINILQKDGLCSVKTNKRTVTLNEPIYIGACVLDLSKLLIYKFLYDTMKVSASVSNRNVVNVVNKVVSI